MATAKMDYKKEYKDLYLPKRKPSVIDVPAIGFIMVDGRARRKATNIKVRWQALLFAQLYDQNEQMSGTQPEGYFEYVAAVEGALYGTKGAFEQNKWTNGCGLS